VFFDWDKADLTDRAKEIVKEAADNSTRVQVTRIEVNGYTDTSGSRLIIRRFQFVAGRR
jgi:OOP family OmpA-OmpF porin